MFPGSPAPLRPGTPLHAVLRVVRSGAPAGAWMREARSLLAIHATGRRMVLVGSDLGALLRHCNRIVVRDGEAVVALPASLLIGWRALEIVLGTPFLPPPSQLRALFPRLRSSPGRVAIPIGLGSAEEALAVCARERVPVVSTRIVYHAPSG